MPEADEASALRIVLDTNVVISGLLWGGQPNQIISQTETNGALRLYSSEAMIEELNHSLHYPKFAKRLKAHGYDADEACNIYRALVTIVEPGPLRALVQRDPDDDVVIATAVAANATLIVSGDKDLQDLEADIGIPVVTVREALAFFAEWENKNLQS
jgi:uncharacterized protein